MEEKDIFKTETIYDEMVHRECVRYYPLSVRSRIWTEIILEICLLLVLPQFGHGIAIQTFLIWTLFFLGFYFLASRKRLRKDYQKILQNNNGEPIHNRFHFRQEDIRLVNPRSGNEMIYSYSQILRIVDTPKLVLLLTTDKKHIVLQKCWLMGGTSMDLTAFLLKHCPKVRRVHGIQLGRCVERIYVATMIVGSVIGLILLSLSPAQPAERSTYAEVAAELSTLGITVSEETIAEVEAFYAEYPQLVPESGFSSADNALELLCMEGMGDYDMETLEWTPSSSGIYWMDTEVFFVDSIYTDFFAGLSAMDEELTFSNVEEDYSKVDIESGMGTLPVSFDFRGQHYEMNARYFYDWFDNDMLFETVRIVNSGGGDRKLYYAYDDGQGFLFYYGTADNVRALEKLTDLQFHSGKAWLPDLYF